MGLRVVRRNVQAGFWDAHGFHPLRRSVDYDPDRPHDEDSGARTDGAGLKTYRGRKVKPIKRAKKKSATKSRAGSKRKPNPGDLGNLRKGQRLLGKGFDGSFVVPVTFYSYRPGGAKGGIMVKTKLGTYIEVGPNDVRKVAAKRRNGLRPARGKESPRVRKALAGYVAGERVTGVRKRRNPPHATYAKQVGASVGYRDYTDGKARQSAATLKDHYSRAFSEPDDPALLKQIGYSPAEIASERAKYRKAVAAFIDGYRFGYTKAKAGFRGLTSHMDREVSARETKRRGRNPGKNKRAERRRFTSSLRRAGVKRAKGPRGYARHEHYATGSIVRGKAMKAPSYRSAITRSNPTGVKVYEVSIPATYYDGGYNLTIRAKSKRTARAEAKAYCASAYAKLTGKTKASYKLPSKTKVREVAG